MLGTALIVLVLLPLLVCSSLAAEEPKDASAEPFAVADTAFVWDEQYQRPIYSPERDTRALPSEVLGIRLVTQRTLFAREHVLQLVEFGGGRFRLECVRHRRRGEFFYVPPAVGLTSDHATHTLYGVRLSINLGSGPSEPESD